MKHDILRSIAHNIADSFASGMGFLVGLCPIDIFGEAQKSPQGYITVDFLNGTILEGEPSDSIIKAVQLYSHALPHLCEKQRSSVSYFQLLTARYSRNNAYDRHVLITIIDKNGYQSVNEYAGFPLQYIKRIDNLGRIRSKRK
jgi:hypothetical protein